MSVDQPDERPLNLRDLASEESPDVVRLALKRFRRRTVIRGLWVAGLALAALLVTPLLPDDRDEGLPNRYHELPGVPVGRSTTVGSLTVTVIDARRVDRQTGAIHLLVSTTENSDVTISEIFEGSPGRGGLGQLHQTLAGRISEVFATIALPFDGTEITASIERVGINETPGAPTNVTIDLSGVPGLRELWR